MKLLAQDRINLHQRAERVVRIIYSHINSESEAYTSAHSDRYISRLGKGMKYQELVKKVIIEEVKKILEVDEEEIS